jgi:biotin carboxylase
MTTESIVPTLLLVGGAGPATLGVDVAVAAMEQARSRGLRTLLMNQGTSLAQTISACQLADEVAEVDFEDVQVSVRWACEQVSEGRPLDVVFSARELAQVTTAHIATAVGARGNAPDAVHRVRTKDACRARLAAAGFSQPAVRVCADPEQAGAALRELPGPWVVKPRDGAGSEGVSLVSDPAQLPAAIGLLPGSQPFLVEEFVVGTELSVEGLFQDGRPHVLAVTAKEKLPPPHFVEVGHTLPAEVPEDTRRDIEATVTGALVTVGLRFGLFHVELWLTAGGIVLGELHTRLGGDYIHRMLPYALPGLEMFGLVFDDARGRPASPPPDCTRGAAVRFFTPPPGRLVDIEGLDRVLNHPAVLATEITARPGDQIRPFRSSDERVGAVVVGADTPAEAGKLARELAESVHFLVEDAPAEARSRPAAVA